MLQNNLSKDDQAFLQDAKDPNETDKPAQPHSKPQFSLQNTVNRALRCSLLRSTRRTRTRLRRLETQHAVLSRQLSDKRLTSERLDEVRGRLSDLETHYIAQIDEKFDSDVYRKALVNSIQEYAFGRIVRTIGLFTLILNAGISVYVYNQIKEVTKETVIEQVPTLISDSEEVVRDNLISLLKDSRDGDELARQQIKNKPKSIELLKEFIAPRKSGESDELADLSNAVERERSMLAIDYAGKTTEPELLETLFEIFNAEDLPLEVRDKAFQALLQYSTDDLKTLERILSQVQEDSGSTNPFLVSVVKHLSTFDAGRNNGVIHSIMQQALLSNEIEAVKSAVIYFILNPGQWQDDDLNSNSSKTVLFNQGKLTDEGELVKLLIASSSSNSSRDKQDEANEMLQSRISPDNSSAEGSSQGFTKNQLREIQKYFALALLRTGNPTVFDSFYYDSISLSSSLYYYSPEEWTEQIYPLFPESNELFSLPPTGTEEEQDQFMDWYYYNTPLQWNATNSEYEKPSAQASIEQLQMGDPQSFLAWMSSNYYDSTDWLNLVYPLFPDATGLFSSTPTGTDEEQDQLWYWVDENIEQLYWNDEQHQYQLPIVNSPVPQDEVGAL